MQYSSERERDVLELETRRQIYNIVQTHAGCHFREIQRKSGLSTGSAQYHLHYLAKKNIIKQEQSGPHTRYFPLNIDTEHKRVLGLLRQKSIRAIVLFILKNKTCTHKQITVFTKLAPSTVSWHLKKLENEKILGSLKNSREIQYNLTIDQNEIMRLLITYRASFIDTLVDNVIEMWE